MKIQVKLIPNSKEVKVEQQPDFLLVRVKSPAKENKANQELIKLLAGYFKVAKSRISILKGHKSRLKTVEISE